MQMNGKQTHVFAEELTILTVCISISNSEFKQALSEFSVLFFQNIIS